MKAAEQILKLPHLQLLASSEFRMRKNNSVQINPQTFLIFLKFHRMTKEHEKVTKVQISWSEESLWWLNFISCRP